MLLFILCHSFRFLFTRFLPEGFLQPLYWIPLLNCAQQFIVSCNICLSRYLVCGFPGLGDLSPRIDVFVSLVVIVALVFPLVLVLLDSALFSLPLRRTTRFGNEAPCKAYFRSWYVDISLITTYLTLYLRKALCRKSSKGFVICSSYLSSPRNLSKSSLSDVVPQFNLQDDQQD